MSTRQPTETESYRQQVMAAMPRQPNEAAVSTYFSRLHRWPDSRPPQRMGEPRTPTAPPDDIPLANVDPAVVARVRESLNAQYRRHGFRPPADSRELNSENRYVDRAAQAIETMESYNAYEAARSRSYASSLAAASSRAAARDRAAGRVRA